MSRKRPERVTIVPEEYSIIKEEDMKVLDDAVATADVKGSRTHPIYDHLTNEDCIPLRAWNGE